MGTATERQQEILDFIRSEQEHSGTPPSIREIAEHFGFQSPNAAQCHVRALREKGLLKAHPGRARSVQVVDPFFPDGRRPATVTIPIYGEIPAGNPIDAVQSNEGCVLIDVETAGIKPNARTFAVRVRGDSMIGKGILDGDLAIIEHGVEPRNGDTVAALIDGRVTLKSFLRQRGKPFLRAENPKYPDLLPEEELQVQGVMVALVRKRK
jgi:repressor LexA